MVKRAKKGRVALPVLPAEPLPAGSFSEWLRASGNAREQQRGVQVPCGNCQACCRSSLFIHIAPDETDALAHIDAALLFPAPGAPPGHVLMGYDAHGCCPMLGSEGCTIYEHRPQTCRDFDCRSVAATALVLDRPQQAIAEQARRWRFEYPAAEDGRQSAAVRAAAAFFVERGPELLPNSLPSHPLQLAQLALRVYQVFYAPGDGQHDRAPSDAELARSLTAAMAGIKSGPTPARARSIKPRRSASPRVRATKVRR